MGNAWIDNEAEYYLPAAVMTVDVQRQEQEVTTYVLNDHGNNQRVIMYLTGEPIFSAPIRLIGNI